MSEDTSSSPRQEWYEEYPEPDEPKVLWGSNLQLAPLVTPPGLKPGQILTNSDGKPLGIIQSFDPATGQVSLMTSGYVTQARRAGKQISVQMNLVAQSIMDGIQASMNAIKAMASSMESEAPVPENESVRDRALRLKQQPHSMTGKDGKFDSKGRCRY